MHWLSSIDVSVFRFVNSSASNRFFDWLMPLASSPPQLGTLIAVALILLVWKGGRRGPVCAIMLAIGLIVGDGLIVNTIKHAVARPRPFLGLEDVMRRVGIGESYSFPSAHAANWFSATMILFIYYRRTIWVMLPFAALVGLSRIYNGVHYPSDVLAGTILGCGYGLGIVWSLDAVWKSVGPRWFPIWFNKMPSLLEPGLTSQKPVEETSATREVQWLRFGYVLIGILLFARLMFLASGKLELSEDEAYQWIWSKHPALSYYSKPLMIAYTQWLGTHIWGDTEFGIRFFSPVFGALLSLVVLRFMAKTVNARAGVLLVAITNTAPLMALGSILMTIDPLSVLFYTLALIAGWRAVQQNGTRRDWITVGVFMGLGLLSKYTNLFQLASWALVFALVPATRKHLKTSGPYLAVLIVALCSLPIVIWNAQHGWITVEHVATDGNLHKQWTPQLRFTKEFIGAEFGLLNPFYFIGALVAVFALWKKQNRTALNIYLFCMGAPVVVTYFVLSFHTRILENWIAPAVLPWLMLMVVYWQSNWARLRSLAKPSLIAGISLGLFFVIIAHGTKLIDKMIGRSLPPAKDPLHRVHGWKETAAIVGEARRKFEAETGKPTFIVGEHYGFTAQVTFYLPEAKASVTKTPLVYFVRTSHPQNQFYFWPTYTNRIGENAIFMREIDRDPLRSDWVKRWWNREGDLFVHEPPQLKPVPLEIRDAFESVTNLGVFDVRYADRGLMRRVQVFGCQNLKSSK
jgi:membrane-associated phospholipid phosphatase